MSFTKAEILEQNRHDIGFFDTFSSEVQEALKLQLLAFRSRNEIIDLTAIDSETESPSLIAAD